jgi:hypothetical protein
MDKYPPIHASRRRVFKEKKSRGKGLKMFPMEAWEVLALRTAPVAGRCAARTTLPVFGKMILLSGISRLEMLWPMGGGLF